MIWFTSDTHFGHANIIKYCVRPWKTVEEMNEALVANWNATVGVRDEVWHLGDFAFREALHDFVPRLRGRINLVLGNHDMHFLAVDVQPRHGIERPIRRKHHPVNRRGDIPRHRA